MELSVSSDQSKQRRHGLGEMHRCLWLEDCEGRSRIKTGKKY